MRERLNILLTLGKVRITAFVAISAALGYILASSHSGLGIILPVLGVFILSCGSSALNQYQEWRLDSLMERTKNRPIPKNQLSPNQSLIIAISAIIIGITILYFSTGNSPFLLGIFAIIWYNGIYTPLKRITPMAVVPGALIGAIPPAIGWVSGGGNLFDPPIISLCLFFFIWQIPHFWLLLLIYDKDYEKAGFPTITKIFPHKQLQRITYAWIVALAASCLLIPFFGLSKNPITIPLLFFAGIILLWRTKSLLNQFNNNKIIRFAFMNINLYVLLVTFVLCADKLIIF